MSTSSTAAPAQRKHIILAILPDLSLPIDLLALAQVVFPDTKEVATRFVKTVEEIEAFIALERDMVLYTDEPALRFSSPITNAEIIVKDIQADRVKGVVVRHWHKAVPYDFELQCKGHVEILREIPKVTPRMITSDLMSALKEFTNEVQKKTGYYSTHTLFFWELAEEYIRLAMYDESPEILCYGLGAEAVTRLRYRANTGQCYTVFKKAAIADRWRALKLIKASIERMGYECKLDWMTATLLPAACPFSITVVVHGDNFLHEGNDDF